MAPRETMETGGGGGKRALLALAGFGAAVAAAAALGTKWSPREGETEEWYAALDRPAWNPPKWVFPLVWTPLYALMAASAYRVWRAETSPARSRALALWGAQLGLNAAWTPLFFGRRNPRAALADILALVPSVAAFARAAGQVDAPAAWMMAPYLAWSSFATALNAEIVRRNPPSSEESPDAIGADRGEAFAAA